MAKQIIAPELNGNGMRVGIVQGRFNADIGAAELSACLTALTDVHRVSEAAITVATVPGALEIPLTLQRMAQTGRYDALIALGAVVRGETYHFEIVSNESAAGIMQVQLDTGVPIANGILTTDSDAQAHARAVQKGVDCAAAAIEMANLLRRLV
jgi:6,7-dimethyl-8-ribityllumazine synthase